MSELLYERGSESMPRKRRKGGNVFSSRTACDDSQDRETAGRTAADARKREGPRVSRGGLDRFIAAGPGRHEQGEETVGRW